MFLFIQKFKTQFSSNFNHFLAVSILSIYPLSYFIGTGMVNISVIILDLILIIEIIKNKKYFFFFTMLHFIILEHYG